MPSGITSFPIPSPAIQNCIETNEGSIVTSNDPPVVAGVGLDFVIAEVQNKEILNNARCNISAFSEADKNFSYGEDFFSLMIYYRGNQQNIFARVFAPLSGIVEDAATGSACGALGALLASQNSDRNNKYNYKIHQGEMIEGTEREFVVQETVMTKIGIERVLDYAFNLAQTRKDKHLTSATKSNGISITMPYWDELFEQMSKKFPNIRTDKYHIDILCAHFVLNPNMFDVVVASNLFGDILSDLGPACTGTIGIAPSGNINPENKYPSLFEPVHGSAPDIAGKGIANPVGQIWAGAMMIDHFGFKEASEELVEAISSTLSEENLRTADLAGKADTKSVGKAIERMLS
mgnify:CR=1 FL=1